MKGFYPLFFFLFIVLWETGAAQDNNSITIDGTLSVEQGTANGTLIEMYVNGRRIQNYEIGNNGRFQLKLEYDREFILMFVRKDNFSQKIVVDTHVPPEVLQSNPVFPPFPVKINLLTEIPGVDKTFSENIVSKILYSKNVDNFISEEYYNVSQIKNQIEQAIARTRQIDKESKNLTQITKSEQSELKKEYDQLIRQAENEYNREEFLSALDGYKAASKILPNEQYPKDRIAEINDLFGFLMVAEERNQAEQKRLEELIKQADNQFDDKDYEEARASYQRALTIEASNVHVQERLAEINKLIDELLVENEFDANIVKADNLFDELLYQEARDFYQKALGIKSNESYPKQKLKEIEEILSQQSINAEKLKGYNEAISQAEQYFKEKLYGEARAMYENALVHKPGDETAIKKIDEIKVMLSELEVKNEFERTIAEADNLYEREQFEEAMALYEYALNLMPAELHPRERVDQIQSYFLEQKKLAAEAEEAERNRIATLKAEQENNYNAAITKADSLFMVEKYEISRSIYQAALEIKPGENYPSLQIQIVDDLLVKFAENKKLYDTILKRGEDAMYGESYHEAKALFLEALQIKPEESLPKEWLQKADSLMEEQKQLAAREEIERQKMEAEAERERLEAEAEAEEQLRLEALTAENNRQYEQTITQADSLYEHKQYKESKRLYGLALQIKPEEEIPAQKIDVIDEILSRQAEEKMAYNAAIERGEDALRNDLFDQAKEAFLKAHRIKPDEDYPGEMTAHIDSIVGANVQLAQEAEKEKIRVAQEAEAARQEQVAEIEAQKERQSLEILARGDSLVELKDYENALAEFGEAEKLKPGNAFPLQRIEEINELLIEHAEVEKNFKTAVMQGDDAFRLGDYESSKVAFEKALDINPNEAYPGMMLAQIDSVLTEHSKQQAEAEAENLRRAAEEEAERQAIQAAIDAELNLQYTKALHVGDSLYGLHAYESAINAYQVALKMKPEQQYVQTRIAEIKTMIEQQAALQLKYAEYVKRGNDLFGKKYYQEAREAYINAQQVLPEELHPKEMLAQIDSIVLIQTQLAAEAEAAEQKRLAEGREIKKQQYDEAIQKGDSLFDLKELESSRLAYVQALQGNNDAMYPQQKINEIDRLLDDAQAAMREKEIKEIEYQQNIELGDQHFLINDYLLAREEYKKASQIKPGEPYPTERIAEVERLLQQQEQDETYKSIVLAADKLFREELWSEAKIEYEKALVVKPGAHYSKEQIDKITAIEKQRDEKLRAEHRVAEELEKRRLEAELRKQEETERKEMNDAGLTQLYQEYITLADDSFESENYNVARAWYYKAWDIKQNEDYPKQRINEIKELVGELLMNQRDKDYQSFIDVADSTFRNNQLAVSRGWYNRALSVKPDESYPKSQLQTIAGLVAESMAGRSGELFNSRKEKGLEAFEKNNYNIARYWFKLALELKSEDDEINEKLKLIQEATNIN